MLKLLNIVQAEVQLPRVFVKFSPCCRLTQSIAQTLPHVSVTLTYVISTMVALVDGTSDQKTVGHGRHASLQNISVREQITHASRSIGEFLVCFFFHVNDQKTVNQIHPAILQNIYSLGTSLFSLIGGIGTLHKINNLNHSCRQA